jgi:hypothetical protein
LTFTCHIHYESSIRLALVYGAAEFSPDYYPHLFNSQVANLNLRIILTGGAGDIVKPGASAPGHAKLKFNSPRSGRQPSSHTYRSSESIPLHWPKR